MGKYILKRVLLTIPVILALLIIVFFIVHLIPGDPVAVMLGRDASPESYKALQQKYGFDKPLPVQFFNWFGNFLKGDLGESLSMKRPVGSVILQRLPRSGAICILSMLLSTLITLPIGIISAKKHNTITDFNITTVTLILVSIPSFWLGIILMIAFSIWIPILPSMGFVAVSKGGVWGSLRTLILPVVTVAAGNAASTTRLLRTSMLEVLGEDYIMLARVKNNPEWRVMLVHALRNASIPVFTTLSMQAAYVLGGSVVVEKVFAIPGLGQLILSAIEKRDYPLIQGCVLTIALIVVIINLITDISYAFLDPRIRLTE